MARKRMIDPGIWQSEDFARLSTLAKLVFIGLFSNADDEGRGRANALYLKSILFPYDEKLRAADMEKTLQEIASHMSVTFYTHDEKEYYVLESWNSFQTINKPTASKIPLPEGYRSGAVGVQPNKKIKEKEEKEEGKGGPRPAKPSLAEIRAYCTQRQNKVDAQQFYDFYQSKGWMVGSQEMRDWKASVRTWERRMETGKDKDRRAFEQREYTKEQRERRASESFAELEKLYGGQNK